MLKAEKKISIILFLTLFALPTLQILSTNAANASAIDNSDMTRIGQKNSLTNDQIKAIWPNLPSAKQIWDTGCFAYIDTSISNSLSEPPINYTCDSINTFGGASVSRNQPYIWLQYNATIWVQVPFYMLKSTGTSDSSNSFGQTLAAVDNWAMGLYANPGQLAGSGDVYGAETFGQFPGNNYSPSEYGTFVSGDLLTVYDGHLWFQISMSKSLYASNFVDVQAWNDSGKIFEDQIFPSPTQGQIYNEYIRYNDQYSAWEFYWNFTLVRSRYVDTGYTRVQTGNQTSVAVESNDGTEENFDNFNVAFGSSYQGNYLPAVGYLAYGNWIPFYSTDHVPAAYVSWGGASYAPPGGSWYIASQGPPTWIGIGSESTETMTVGTLYSRQNNGVSLWPYS